MLRRPFRFGSDPRGHLFPRSFRAYTKLRLMFRFHRSLSLAPGFPFQLVWFVSSSFVWFGSVHFFSVRCTNPHQHSPWSCCFLQMVFAQQLPGLLRPFHARRTTPCRCTHVCDERLETSSYSMGMGAILLMQDWRSNQTRPYPKRNGTAHPHGPLQHGNNSLRKTSGVDPIASLRKKKTWIIPRGMETTTTHSQRRRRRTKTQRTERHPTTNAPSKRHPTSFLWAIQVVQCETLFPIAQPWVPCKSEASLVQCLHFPASQSNEPRALANQPTALFAEFKEVNVWQKSIEIFH